jgi:aldehyde dehydrogenase (NAD+)
MILAIKLLVAKIINDNFDSNYLHVVEGGIPETTALLNQRFDKIFFTGSPAVGKIVNKASAEHLTNVTLELGGKNPVIIDKNVSLNVAVKRMLWAKFTNAGQLCIAPDYVLVHKEIKEQFLKTVVKEIKKSNYSQENNNFVRIINEKNYNRLIKLIDENKIYYGGNHDRNELKIEPTILTNVSLSDKVMQEEIFGPILAVIDYDTTDEAFEIIKKMEKPLASYLYTNDKNLKNRFLKEIPFGSGGINESVMQISNPNLPFGGVGNSGIGSYHGKYSFNCFSHFKSIIDKPTFIELNLKHYGYNQKKINIFKKLF